MTWRLRIVVGIVCVLLPACASSTPEDPSAGQRADTVLLVEPAPEISTACEEAADALDAAVECPRLVPATFGRRPISCAEQLPTPSERPAAGCVEWDEGRLTINGHFEGPAGYEGIDETRGGHLAIVQRFGSAWPDLVCPDQRPVTRPIWAPPDVLVVDCPDDSPDAEVRTLQGEGIHRGHRVVSWERGGARYEVGLHGHSEENGELLAAIVCEGLRDCDS